MSNDQFYNRTKIDLLSISSMFLEYYLFGKKGSHISVHTATV